MTKQGYEITDRETGEVVHFVDCTGKSARQMDRIEMGLLNRVDLSKHFVRECGRPVSA